jgi:hypothetical protein
VEAIDPFQLIGLLMVAPVLVVFGTLACWELFKVLL